MSSGMLIDGFDPTTIGFMVESVTGHRNVPDRVYPVAEVDGREDAVVLSEEGITKPRRITVTAFQSVPFGVSLQTLQDRRDELSWRLSRRAVRLAFTDDPERFIVARAEPFEMPLVRPDLTQRAHRIRITFLCADPHWYDEDETTVVFTNITQEVPLGSAPARGVINIVGPINPFVIAYYDYDGNEQSRMEFADTTLGGGETLAIDNKQLTITRNGTLNGAELLTAGTFIRLDPKDAESLTGQQPLIGISQAGTLSNITYRKAWL